MWIEYAEAMPEYDTKTDEQIGWAAGKSFGADPNRALEEGRTLVYREVGEWKKVEA